MARVLAEAETQGRIHGVIHAAAVEYKALIVSRDRPVEETEFRPKVLGTLVLDRLFRDRPLDFMVLCSSITAVVGGAGQVGYCAANAFLDAFAVLRSRERSDFTVSIDWGRWQGIGLARDFESWHQARTGRELGGGMSVAEGLESLERILAHRIGPRVAVVPAEWQPAGAQSSNGVAAKPPLPAPGTDGAAIERQLAEIWCSILGTAEFDRQATFQELGGDSLIGIQMIARIRERLGVQLPINAVFDCPTVDALALRIVQEQTVEMEEGTL
jgi:acyl carrier protein